MIERDYRSARDCTDSLVCITIKLQEKQMPRGREKDRELRRKHLKNQKRMKALEVAQKKAGSKK
ncbi:MAG: hypothetical protein O2999_04750 [Nitrospirae bacterium]|nr:hypothetical protein [Nitrospirota bacterium]MDA1303595.1 hypothetical protein [Nitrospirota bacterium]